MADYQYKIVGAQLDFILGEPSKNLESMLSVLKRPEASDAHLVIFPECALTGYCFESREEGWQHAQSLDGEAVKRFTEACQQSGKYVAFGTLERLGEKLHNSCVLVGPNGVVGVYRKIHLPYLGIDRFVDPGTEGWNVFDIGGLRVGMQICYDGSFPEATRVMTLLGADLVILPTNWPPGADTFAKYLTNARALENCIYFFAVDRIGTERGFQFIGQSRFCDPNGNAIADAPHTREEILGAVMDVRKARVKRLVRVPGKHVIDRLADRRPEYYGLVVQPHNLIRQID